MDGRTGDGGGGPFEGRWWCAVYMVGGNASANLRRRRRYQRCRSQLATHDRARPYAHAHRTHQDVVRSRRLTVSSYSFALTARPKFVFVFFVTRHLRRSTYIVGPSPLYTFAEIQVKIDSAGARGTRRVPTAEPFLNFRTTVA